MNIDINNRYGYKLCYSEPPKKKKLYIHIVTNSYSLVKWEKDRCQRTEQYSRIDNHKLYKPTWYVLPVKNKTEYKRLWKGCPF